MAPVITYAQEDTLHISTDKRDGIVYSRYYVINDSQFMIVHYKAEKNDTIMEESIPEYYQEFYKRMGHRTKRIRERGDEKHRKTFIYKELRGLRL